MATAEKYSGTIVEYLDGTRLRPALAIREQGHNVVVTDANGRDRSVSRDLVLVRHPERATRENLPAALKALDEERTRLAAELDLNLLWEVVREHERGYSAEELAELFFGRRSATATAVMLEALLGDRLFFVRRHLEFVARSTEQVDRLRLQYEKIRLRSESGRRTRSLIRDILDNGIAIPTEESAPLVADLTDYLLNPFTRSRELTATLEDAIGDITPAEAAYEILDRLGAPPPGARFALIGGVRTAFNDTILSEAQAVVPPERPGSDDDGAFTIDDEETVEVDDALSSELLPDGSLRVRIHIALVADFVSKGGPMDTEAGLRGATVYLPETTVRMLPDQISTDAASLLAGRDRHVLTTDVRLSPTGDLLSYSIYPSCLRVASRLSYEEADRLLANSDNSADDWRVNSLKRLNDAATNLREQRRHAGAILVQRREPKISVVKGEIDLKIIDNASPSRQLVAEFMVLSNFVTARFAAERSIPMIYRVQPGSAGDFSTQRPHLSLHPQFHAGVGLDYYVQASSPIRRYMDLVLQRQLLTALAQPATAGYSAEELLSVLANAEAAETDGRELERKAKRYWLLRFLKQHALDHPLEATVLRDGASAELDAYAVRGTLRGAPNVASQSHLLVRINRLDPLRGWLTLDYAGPSSAR